MSPSTTPTRLLNPPRDGDCTPFLGSLFQGLTTLLGKNCFLMFNLNHVGIIVKTGNTEIFLCEETWGFLFQSCTCIKLKRTSAESSLHHKWILSVVTKIVKLPKFLFHKNLILKFLIILNRNVMLDHFLASPDP